MKRIITGCAILLFSFSAKSDVIYFPYQYSLVSYSAEFVYSYELATKIKSSTVFWGGAGIVGSFFYLDEPAAGIELAVERRRYFKPGQFNRFFISGYCGVAFMTDFQDRCDLGVVPGFKFNYKAQLTQYLIFEPYVSLSLPITLDLDYMEPYIPFPVVTIGIRLGIHTLRKNLEKNAPETSGAM